MIHLGTVPSGDTLYIPFNTFDSNDPSASVTASGLAVTDIEIYKNGSVTQRSSDSGYTLLDTDGIDFDGITGVHGISVDLSDNTDAGFFAVGSWYWVVVSSITVDAATINFVAATFRIGPAESATGYQPVDVAYISGDSGAADNLELDYDGTGYTKTNSTVGTVTTLTGHTAQTGDSFARLGAPAGASVSADIATVDTNVDTLLTRITSTLFSGITSLAEWLGLMAGKQTPDATALAEIKTTGAGSGTYDATADSLEAIRDRGDAAWTTGGGGSISDILNLQPVIPISIDLANTATVRLGLMLTNALDDLPSTAEITPGTIDIDRKAIGGTSWTSVVSAAACSEQAGLIYYDEVFDSGTGYAEGDSIRVTFKSQKITVSANDYEITDANGVMFQTYIRETMRGTDSAALASALTTHDGKLDTLTTTVGAAGAGLTEAGGTGDHLTAINLPDQTMNITGDITGNLSGSVGSVTGAVGSVTGNVGGNVAGSVGSVTGAVGSVTGTVGGVAGTITTLDALDTAQDTQHSTTQGLVTTVDTNVDAIKVITDAIGATAAANLALTLSATGAISGTASGSPTTTTIPASDLSSSVDDFYNGRVLLVTSGSLAGQVAAVSDYTGSTKTLTVSAMTSALSASDTFILI